MGQHFSQSEYKKQLNKFSEEYLSLEHSQELDNFLKISDDFTNVFTSVSLEDFRTIKDHKTDNIVHIVSHAVKVMHDMAKASRPVTGEEELAKLKGAIHVLNRIFPLLFEEKELFIRCMWREQALFDSQINAINMMEAISLLLFKEGFTIMPLPDGITPQYYGIDENLVWRSGISVPGATNHNNYQYDKNRTDLLRLMITILSQPLFYAPDEYLLVLNPFSTYFSNKRSKNCKNLFVSLINIIVSYDVTGYGVPYISAIDQAGEQEVLVTLAIHLLLILIEYKPPSFDNLNFLIRGGHISLNKVFQYFMKEAGAMKEQPQTTHVQSQIEVNSQLKEAIIEDLTSNEFFRLLRVIHGRMNLDPLYEGFSKYFQNIIDTNATYLPQSLNVIPFYQEISILLWRFMTLNTHVFEDFTERADFHNVILLGVIILMDQSKKDPTKSNLMYLTIFLLLTISASRELAMNLNTPFNLNIKLDLIEVSGWSASGNVYTFADLVFVSVYGLIKNGPRLLRPIYKSIIAILSNIAPYTKNLCKEGCEGLMYLLNVFAKKEFLLEKEDNCKTLGSLIEAINYLIAYHDETNHYLQIQLMKYQSVFDYLEQTISQIGQVRDAQITSQNQPQGAQNAEVFGGAPDDEEVQQLDAEEEGSPSQADDQKDASELSRQKPFQEQEDELAQPRQQFQIISKEKRDDIPDVTDEGAEATEEARNEEKSILQKGAHPEPAQEKVSRAAIAKQEIEDLEQKAQDAYQKQAPEEETAGDSMTSQGNDMMAAFLARANEQKKQEQTPVTADTVVQAIAEVQQEIKGASEAKDEDKDDEEHEEQETTVEQEKQDKPDEQTDQDKATKEEEDTHEKNEQKLESANPYAGLAETQESKQDESKDYEGGEDAEASDEDEWEQQRDEEEEGHEEPVPSITAATNAAQGGQPSSQSMHMPVQPQQQVAEQQQQQMAHQQPAQETRASGQATQIQAPIAQQQAAFHRYPEYDWFQEWKKTLNLQNIRACISHTYNKAMNIRTQMIEQDYSLSSLQIFNIDEDILLQHLQRFSLKGLIPNMPKILVTTYKGNDSIDTWLISYLWGLIFVFAQEYSVYDHRRFKLFTINTYQGQNHA